MTSILCSVLLAFTPITAWAEGEEVPTNPEPAPALAPLLITEIQTRTAEAVDNAAYKEFIELYNTTDQPIDLDTGRWKLLIAKNGATKWEDATQITLVGSIGTGADGGSYVVGSVRAGVAYPSATPVTFAAGLSDDGGHVRLVYETTTEVEPGTCTSVQTVVDQAEWGGANSGIKDMAYPTGRAVAAKTGLPAGDSLQRKVLDGQYLDRDNDAADFINGLHTVGTVSTLAGTADPVLEAQPAVSLPADCPAPADEPDGQDDDTTVPPQVEEPPYEYIPPEPATEDTAPQPTIPAANSGLKSPLLSEFLPNPASPLTDANDEFIELYNSNDAYFDLSGYILEAGLTTLRRYVIPAGTRIPPRTFLAFFSAQSNLALSNSGGRVTLLDPLGRTLAASDAYGAAKDGQAWVFADGIWQWTTKPTPNALNVVAAPAVKSKSTTKKSAKASAALVNKSGANSTSAGQGSEQDIERAAVLAASSSTPVHPGALALIAVSAVLYGAYEYRRDVANRLYQFRTNRAARRALRQNAEGR